MANSRRALGAWLLLFTALAVLLVPAVAFPQSAPIVGTAMVSTEPNTVFTTPSATFTVDVHVNLSGLQGTCNAALVAAALGSFNIPVSFDNTQVNYVSRTACAAPPPEFPNAPLATPTALANANGTVAIVNLQSVSETTPTGDVCVATLTFQALAGFTGSTTIIPDCVAVNPLGVVLDLYTPLSFSCTGAGEFAPALIPSDSIRCEGTTVSLLVASADLTVVKTDSADPVPVNGTLTYTLTVTNAGPDPSSGGTVVDFLPAGVTFVSASAGCVNAAGTVTCTLGVIPSGGSQLFTIDVTAPGTAQVLTNAATVTGNEDGNAANDTDTETTSVSAVVAVVPVPALSLWGLLALGFMLALLGYATLRRRQAQA